MSPDDKTRLIEAWSMALNALARVETLTHEVHLFIESQGGRSAEEQEERHFKLVQIVRERLLTRLGRDKEALESMLGSAGIDLSGLDSPDESAPRPE